MTGSIFRSRLIRSPVVLLAIAVALAVATFLLAPGARSAVTGAPALATSCPASLVPGGHDYHGLPLTMCNFSGLDLSNADFKGATLTGVVFIRSKLAGADFSGATIVDSGNAAFPTDFSFADLSNAKFILTKFNGPTYLTYAALTCADFSQTNLNNGNAIFGDQPLVIAANSNCRTTFNSTTMNCEFVPQWKQFDLTSANIAACNSQLQTVAGRAGYDFSGGIYSNVVFDDLNLTGSTWTGAVLEGTSFQGATLDNASGLQGTAAQPSRLSIAKFNKASVQNVDLSNTQLYGAQFINANLSNSSFAGAFLSNNTAVKPPIETAAKFDGAHLLNVNMANAKLQGASFTYASLYGSFGGSTPTIPCKTTCSRPGFTCTCATASQANLTNADFSNAFLFGVDFTGATVNGTKFGSAILTGASFAGAKFQVDGGAPPGFGSALLQGTQFDPGANLVGTNMLNAFVDFGISGSSGGNILYLLLPANYTGFKGWQGAVQPCVQTQYASYSTVPSNASMICPSGNSAVCGAGKTAPSIANWKSAIPMASNSPVPGWYAGNATYDNAPANQSAICNNNATVDPNW